jgi:hypothetical protein
MVVPGGIRNIRDASGEVKPKSSRSRAEVKPKSSNDEAEESALSDFERDIDRLGKIEFGFDAGDALVVEVNCAGFNQPLRFTHGRRQA